MESNRTRPKKTETAQETATPETAATTAEAEQKAYQQHYQQTETAQETATPETAATTAEAEQEAYQQHYQQTEPLEDGAEPAGLSFHFENGALHVVDQHLESFPEELVDQYATSVRYLDLSFNQLSSAAGLDKFVNIDTLVLDQNKIKFLADFPAFQSLRVLSLNGNEIEQLEDVISMVETKLPSLRHLSILKNPACPNFFNGKDQEDYQKYRYYILYRLKTIQYLDSTPVTEAELAEAKRVGCYLKVAKVDPSQAKGSKAAEESEQKYADLPQDLRSEGQHSSRFGVSRYVHVGRQSEGNRFIMNSDL